MVFSCKAKIIRRHKKLTLVLLKDLTVEFPTPEGPVRAVDKVNLEVKKRGNSCKRRDGKRQERAPAGDAMSSATFCLYHGRGVACRAGLAGPSGNRVAAYPGQAGGA